MCVLVPSSAVYTMEYYYLVSYNLYHSANNWNMKSRAMQTLTDITTCKTTCKVGAQTCWHTLLILWINFHVITYFSILASICRCHKKGCNIIILPQQRRDAWVLQQFFSTDSLKTGPFYENNRLIYIPTWTAVLCYARPWSIVGTHWIFLVPISDQFCFALFPHRISSWST